MYVWKHLHTKMRNIFFQSAISQNTGRLDDLLISSFLMAKWHQLKYKEAYECAVGFIEHGYESLVVPIKNQMLAALSEIIAEKAESHELTEDDYFMVFEYYRSVGDTENALVLGEYALKNKFKGGRWIVSMAEFYYECERIDDVQRLIEEAYSQTIDISTTERNKIKTLKAGIFFSQGRIEDAYELMESMYYSEDCRNYQRIFMGEMCAATGRLIEAGKIYDYLSSQSPGQPVYLFELAIGNFGYVVVCIVGALLALNGSISFGVIVAFMLYIRLFTQPLTQLEMAATNLQSTAAASERVFEFLAQPEMENESSKKASLAGVNGDVEFRNVRFGYNEDKVIIHDFSAKAKTGQKIAIVGPTGAGKTTMVNLLMRFYDVQDGEILIDGTPIQSLSRENVRSLFCIIL